MDSLKAGIAYRFPPLLNQCLIGFSMGHFFNFTHFMLHVCKRLITHKNNCIPKKLQQAEVHVAGAFQIGWM